MADPLKTRSIVVINATKDEQVKALARIVGELAERLAAVEAQLKNKK